MSDSISNSDTETPKEPIIIDSYIKNFFKANLERVFSCYSQILEEQNKLDPKAKFGRKPSHLFRNLFGNTKPNSENSMLLYCVEFIFNNFQTQIESTRKLKQLLQEQTDFDETIKPEVPAESSIEIETPAGIIFIEETRTDLNKKIQANLDTNLMPKTLKTPADHEISAWLIDQINRN